jgi:hypothetical protein
MLSNSVRKIRKLDIKTGFKFNRTKKNLTDDHFRKARVLVTPTQIQIEHLSMYIQMHNVQ